MVHHLMVPSAGGEIKDAVYQLAWTKQMNLRQLVITVLLLSLSHSVSGGSVSLAGKTLDPPEFLPVDEAFLLTASKSGDSIQLHWLLQPGYYLYRKRFSFTGLEGLPEIPEGEQKHDEFFGDVEVYYDELVISIPFSGSSRQDSAKFTVEYQGCADAGLCYPVQSREFILNNL